MKTYVEVYVAADGAPASEISAKLLEMGMEPSFGEHDFVNNWPKDAVISEVLVFIDRVQAKLKGTGAILSFKTIR